MLLFRALRTLVLGIVVGGVAVGACLAALVPGGAEIASAHQYTVKTVTKLRDLSQKSTVYWSDGVTKMDELGVQDRQNVSFNELPVPRHQRRDRHRRPDVLDERRHRPRRRVPCLRHQRHVRWHRTGRVDDHAAAGEEPHPVAGARCEPQGQGDRGRAPAEREVLEEEDPRGVSQHRLLRSELVRHQERGVALLHHAGHCRVVPPRQAPRRAHDR